MWHTIETRYANDGGNIDLFGNIRRAAADEEETKTREE
jgi:hypothetical protein